MNYKCPDCDGEFGEHEAGCHTRSKSTTSATGEGQEELLPCPFCGGEATLEEVTGMVDRIRWSPGCSTEDCIGYQTMTTFQRQVDAIKAWNRRASPQPEATAAQFDYSPWTPPFYYDDLGTRIVDAKERIILDVRGWGFLTGKGQEALGMTENKAEDIQNAIGEHVTRLLNLQPASDAATQTDEEIAREAAAKYYGVPDAGIWDFHNLDSIILAAIKKAREQK